MTNDKKVSIGKIASISLLSVVMMFAAAATGMTQAHAGVDPAVEFCLDFFGGTGTGIGVVDEEGITLVKCWDTNDPCFDEGVPLKSTEPTTCTILVFAVNETGQNVILTDAVNAEWSVEYQDFGGPNASENCDDNLASANKKDNGKSATLLTCDATDDDSPQGAFLEITTRESPGKGHKEGTVYKPTSCELYANEGAQLIAADEDGNIIFWDDDDNDETPEVPLVLAETGPIPVPVSDEECEEPEI